MNRIFLKGRYFNKYETSLGGEHNAIKGQIMVSQRVKDGTGYNGGNYDTVFFNIIFDNNSLQSEGDLRDKDDIVLEGVLKQNSWNDKNSADKKSSTAIKCSFIAKYNKKQFVQANTFANNMQNDDFSITDQNSFNADDSILWDD